MLNNVVGGSAVTQMRDDIYLIDVVAPRRYRTSGQLETLRRPAARRPDGRPCPLFASSPTLTYETRAAAGLAPRPRADHYGPGRRAPGVAAGDRRRGAGAGYRAVRPSLPAGYDIAVGGTVEESAKAQARSSPSSR